MKRIFLFFLFFTSSSLLAEDVSSEQKKTTDKLEETSVKFINAVSVKSIALEINEKKDYPEFGQGLYTGDISVFYPQAKCLIKNFTSGVEVHKTVQIESNVNQSVVFVGDFSTDWPADKLPLSTDIPKEYLGKKFPPNVQALVFSHYAEPDDFIRYRVVNGMPRKVLDLVIEGKPLQVMPGQEFVLRRQSKRMEIHALVEGKPISVLMTQGKKGRNGLVIFFLKDGMPTFMRAFENTNASLRALLEVTD